MIRESKHNTTKIHHIAKESSKRGIKKQKKSEKTMKKW